jgi:hypothetical protein
MHRRDRESRKKAEILVGATKALVTIATSGNLEKRFTFP